MSDLESRLFFLEQQLAGRIGFDIANLKNQLAALQNASRQGGFYGAGGGSGGGQYLGCTTTGDLPAGSPGTALTGQTVWTVNFNSGAPARSNTDTNATLLNDTPHDIPSGTQVVVAKSGDGSAYIVVNTVC